MPFTLIFYKSVSFTSDINSGIITSEDLHYCFRGPAFSILGPALLLPDLHYHFWGLLSLPRPALLLPDLHYFTVTFPSREVKQTEGN